MREYAENYVDEYGFAAYVFVFRTFYKSGREREEDINANTEEQAEKIYLERHKRRMNLVDSYAIVDVN